MLKTLKYRLIFACLLLVFLYVGVNTLLTKPVDSSNTITVKLHLNSVIANKPGRGSLNYDLYVLDDNEHYKIAADYADCFDYNDFQGMVSRGQLVTMQIRKENGALLSDLKLIVSLSSNEIEYLSADCVNRQISEDKINLPIFFAIAVVLIYILLYYQERKELKKRKSVV
jgi:hypothetical protein